MPLLDRACLCTHSGQHPENARDMGGKIALTVRPYQEAVQVTNGQFYTSGTFAFRVKSAAVVPGACLHRHYRVLRARFVVPACEREVAHPRRYLWCMSR